MDEHWTSNPDDAGSNPVRGIVDRVKTHLALTEALCRKSLSGDGEAWFKLRSYNVVRTKVQTELAVAIAFSIHFRNNV